MREDEDEAYFEEPEFQDILHQYEAARQEGRTLYLDADDLTDIAEYYMVHEREQEASEAIALATSLHPDSVDPQIFLARQQMFHDNLTEAHRLCDAIPDQEDREVLFLRAELMIRDGLNDEAVRFLEHKAKDQPDSLSNYLYDSAGVFIDYALWEQALHFAQLLETHNPRYPKLPSIKAEILYSMGRYQDAIPQLRTLLEVDPYKLNGWNLLAEAHGALAQYHQAMEAAEYALAIEPGDKRAIISKAGSLFHLNDLNGAHKLYQDYLRQHPQDDAIHYLDGVCLANMEHFEEAAQALQRADELSDGLSPEQLHIHLQQAYVQSKLHHLPEALQALQKAQSLATDDFTIEYDLLIGEILLENHLKAEAEEYFKSAIDKSEDRGETLLTIGISYAESQYYEDAIEILRTHINLYPGSHDAIPYLAYCYFNLKDQQNYLKYLKTSAQQNRETTEFLFQKLYPGVNPDDYYLYAYRDAYGHFPEQ